MGWGKQRGTRRESSEEATNVSISPAWIEPNEGRNYAKMPRVAEGLLNDDINCNGENTNVDASKDATSRQVSARQTSEMETRQHTTWQGMRGVWSVACLEGSSMAGHGPGRIGREGRW